MSLPDSDGSESVHGFVLSGVPADVTVQYEGAQSLGNGLWFIPNPTGGSVDQLNIVLRAPEGAEPLTLQISATSVEAGQPSTEGAQAITQVVIDPAGVVSDDQNGGESNDSGGQGQPNENGDGDSSNEPGDGSDNGSSGEHMGDHTDSGSPGDTPELTGENLLSNGDFGLYGSENLGWEGNIYSSFRDWQESGPLTQDYYRMVDKPYVGVWNDTVATSSLTQSVASVTGGSVIELKVAWNNPDHIWSDTGNSVTFQVVYAGVVYATIVTESSGPQEPGHIPVATINAFNGAHVDVDALEAWFNDPGSKGGDSRTPDDLSAFETIRITFLVGLATSPRGWQPDRRSSGRRCPSASGRAGIGSGSFGQ
jgi:hypothetical protein